MLTGFERNGQQPGLALIPESEAIPVNADDSRVVQDAIEHRGGQHAIAGDILRVADTVLFKLRNPISCI